MTPYLSYFICATRRSGSWLLAGGLEDTRVAGHPSEWFNDREEKTWCERWGLAHPIVNYEEYLDRVIETGMAGTGIFGAKCLGVNFKDLGVKFETIPRFRHMPLAQIISAVFPNTRYIWLTRRDKARQAVSYYRARKTDQWFSMEGYPDAPGDPAPLTFDPEEIRRGEKELGYFDDMWRDYFSDAHLSPLALCYEDLAAHYEDTIRAVLGYLEVKEAKDIRIGPPRFRKQADALTEEWVRRYQDYKSANGLP